MSADRKMKKLMSFIKDEEGLVMIEYGLIAALIAVALIATFILVADEINLMFGRIVSAFAGA
jgi:pilus assembly protein Flp/PilA